MNLDLTREGEMPEKIVGVIGGSGLYEMEGLEDIQTVSLKTPFGDPSDSFIVGRLEGVKVAFLPRHGKGHRIQPSSLNFRANIYGMKKLGVQWIIGVSAVGSMKESIHPGDMVIPNQFIDQTKGRANTFFSDGIVGHISFADPVCPILSQILFEAGKNVGATVHQDGTYIKALPNMGGGYHWNDQPPRGETGPGSRDLLLHHRLCNRLRLLA
jgi:5'-methylthioadenosine phosphorylase